MFLNGQLFAKHKIDHEGRAITACAENASWHGSCIENKIVFSF